MRIMTHIMRLMIEVVRLYRIGTSVPAFASVGNPLEEGSSK